jgi:phosphoserine phosphatase RsbU/P
LKPGAQLSLLTDGVVEARSPTGELFGFARAQSLSRKSAEEILEAARAFGQEDDITVVTLALAGAAPPVQFH